MRAPRGGLAVGPAASAPPLVLVLEPGEYAVCGACRDAGRAGSVPLVIEGGRVICRVCRAWRALDAREASMWFGA